MLARLTKEEWIAQKKHHQVIYYWEKLDYEEKLSIYVKLVMNGDETGNINLEPDEYQELGYLEVIPLDDREPPEDKLYGSFAAYQEWCEKENLKYVDEVTNAWLDQAPEYRLKGLFKLEMSEEDFIEEYLDTLYEDYLRIPAKNDVWIDLGYLQYQIIDNVIKEIKRFRDWGGKRDQRYDDFVKEAGVSYVEELTPEQLRELWQLLLPIIY